MAGFAPDLFVPHLGCTVGDELLKVHRSYLRVIQSLHEKGLLKGAAHITGGGITDNTPRILPAGLAVKIDTGAWKIPPVFELLRSLGNLPDDDFRRTFNLGIGLVMIVEKNAVQRVLSDLKSQQENAYIIGQVSEV